MTETLNEQLSCFLDGELPMARVRAIAQAGAKALAPLWGAAGELGARHRQSLGLPEEGVRLGLVQSALQTTVERERRRERKRAELLAQPRDRDPRRDRELARPEC